MAATYTQIIQPRNLTKLLILISLSVRKLVKTHSNTAVR